MQTSLFRRLAPSLAARFQRNENLISSFSFLSSSSSSVLHHVTSPPSSSADVEPVHITENCVRRIKELDSNEPSAAGKMLRLSVETGGCSGFPYAFNLDDGVNADDRGFEKEGIKLVVDNISYDFVKGATVDYVEELIRSAFIVTENPSAVGGCSRKHLLKPITKPPPAPQPPILNPPQPPPQPNPSFFPPTLSPTQHYTHFLQFLNTHLTTPLTPQTLTHFLKSKLHHHPSFTHYDFHLFNWASTLDTFSHNHTSYEWMTRTLALSHRFSLLRTLLNFISSNPCTCSHAIFSCPKTEPIFRFAIHAYCKASKFDDALFAFSCMRKLIDGKPSVSLCNILIHGFVKSGRFDRAFEFYKEMVKNRVKADVFTFNILISGYCRNFKFGSALEMFDEMRKMGCHPNVVTFNTLIKGLFRECRVDEGIGMVYEMIELGCQLSNVTCDILVDGLCKEGHVSKACELLMELSKREVLPKGYDYFVLVEVLCGNGDAFKALEVIYVLWSKGCVPSLISCIVMIDGLRGLGKTEEAMIMVEKMLKEVGMVLDVVTFNSVLQDLCDAGRTKEANRLRLLALSKGLEPDGMTYKILVTGYRREGNRTDGELMVNEMLDRGFIPNLASYNKLMDGLSNCQRPGHYQANKFGS